MKVENIRAVVFDLDGTLLNTLEDLANATNWALRHNGLPERTIDEVRRFVGNGVRRLIERAVPADTEAALLEQVFADFKTYYVSHCQDCTCLYDGIPEMLEQLKAGGYKMAIVSNKLQAGVDELYEFYFRETIEVAVGEREGIRRKPAPDMVETALKELGISADEAVYVGDSDVDLQTARNSGLACISVLWGFRDRDFLVEHGATCMVERPAEIVSLLNRRDEESKIDNL